MAFVDSDGRNISFECSALIDELKQDIAIMGEDRVEIGRASCRERV